MKNHIHGISMICMMTLVSWLIYACMAFFLRESVYNVADRYYDGTFLTYEFLIVMLKNLTLFMLQLTFFVTLSSNSVRQKFHDILYFSLYYLFFYILVVLCLDIPHEYYGLWGGEFQLFIYYVILNRVTYEYLAIEVECGTRIIVSLMMTLATIYAYGNLIDFDFIVYYSFNEFSSFLFFYFQLGVIQMCLSVFFIVFLMCAKYKRVVQAA